MDVGDTTRVVFGVIARHVAEGQAEKVGLTLPEEVRVLWPEIAPDREQSDQASAAAAHS
jgi:uncharacterized protein (DUF2267 family)